MHESILNIQNIADSVYTQPAGVITSDFSNALTDFELLTDPDAFELILQIYNLLEQLSLLTS